MGTPNDLRALEISQPGVIVKFMFDTLQPGPRPDATISATEPGPGPDLASVPLERLEAQICELAGHLAAATCRFWSATGPGSSPYRSTRSWPAPVSKP
jgi:hypothetical protein